MYDTLDRQTALNLAKELRDNARILEKLFSSRKPIPQGLLQNPVFDGADRNLAINELESKNKHRSILQERSQLKIVKPATTIESIRAQHVPSNWPQTGGRGELKSSSHLFCTEEYRIRYRAGKAREIYVAGGAGLKWLVNYFRMSLYKVSTCSYGRMHERMDENTIVRYGSEYWEDGRFIANIDGFEDWSASFLTFNNPTAPNSPVIQDSRSIIVIMPDTMTEKAFDLAFDFEVQKGALNEWIVTPDGQRHCARLGVKSTIAQRYTPYRLGGAIRHLRAKEIVSFRRNRDADRLVTIAENVILKHLGLI